MSSSREKLLLRIEDAFQLTGRGLAVAPPLTEEHLTAPDFGRPLPVRLVRPDGSELQAVVRIMLEFFVPTGPRWICYLEGVKKTDVPTGTEVWLREETTQP